MAFTAGVKQQLQPLVRGLATSTPTAAAAPALLSSFFSFGGSRIDVPLSETLPAVTTPPRGSAPATKPSLQTSALADGVKLATIDSVSPVSSLAVFVEGGAAAETPSTTGAAKVLAAVAFQATSNRSTFRLTRELEKIGASAYAKAGRDHIAFGVDFVRLNQREALEILSDAVFNARYTYWEVRDTLETVKEQLADALKNPSTVVTEVLHRAAFDGSLGNTVTVDPAALASFDNATLHEYVASIMAPSRVVIAGVGVDHAEVAGLAAPLIKVPSGGAAPAGSKYTGGSMNVLTPTASAVHLALGFEANGGVSDGKTAALAAIIKALLDEARPTLPYSRKEDEVFSTLTPFAHLYKSTGIVGLSASAPAGKASALADAVSKKVEALAKGVSEAQLSHAKSLALGELKASTASTSGLLASVGSHVLSTGKFDAAAAAAQLQGVTTTEVASYVASMLKASPTFVAYGNLSSLPKFDSIAKRFA